MTTSTETATYAHECRIRDLYSDDLCSFRQDEKLIGKEQWYMGSRVRVDMRTVDKSEVIREWEFKIHADYDSLGQILTYVALSRVQSDFKRKIQGVIAAFTFQPEMVTAVEVMNLGIELVTLPPWMALAGNVPLLQQDPITIPRIPKVQ